MIMLAAMTKITDISTGKTFMFIALLALIIFHNVNKYFKIFLKYLNLVKGGSALVPCVFTLFDGAGLGCTVP